MAYQQPHNNAYGNTQAQHYDGGSIVPDLPPAQPQGPPGGGYQQPQQYNAQPQGYYQQEYDSWDGKSNKSFQSTFAGSQVHLTQQYDMAQVHGPVPSVPYQQYPAQEYPPMRQTSQQSSGWSQAREKMLKRRSVVQVELQEGNLVLDLKVPSHIVPATMADKEECTKLRYTAATCDPDNFLRSKYSLRPFLYGRQTELFIVMTMYNEDEVLFCRTMNA